MREGAKREAGPGEIKIIEIIAMPGSGSYDLATRKISPSADVENGFVLLFFRYDPKICRRTCIDSQPADRQII